MGCQGSKTSLATAAPASASATLLDISPTLNKQPWGKCTEITTFSMFMETTNALLQPEKNGCFAATEDGTKLRVEDAEGGTVGLWNSRGGTEKVRSGDFVMKVRSLSPESQWVAGDAMLMLAALMSDGVLEAEIKRAPTLDVKVGEVPVTEKVQVVAVVDPAGIVEEPVEEPEEVVEDAAHNDAALRDASK